MLSPTKTDDRSKVVASKGKNIRFYIFMQKNRSGNGITAEVLTTSPEAARKLFGEALGRTPPSAHIHDWSYVDWWYINSMDVGEVRLKQEGQDKKALIHYHQWARKALATRK